MLSMHGVSKVYTFADFLPVCYLFIEKQSEKPLSKVQ